MSKTESALATDVEVDFDPVELAIMGNRVEAIVRETQDAMLRAGRSSVLAVARDLSTAVVTAEGEMFAVAESIPIHGYATGLQARCMTDHHPNLKEGDAFIDNDPYIGATHPADMAHMVPVFVDGEHMFTSVVTCHVADVGASEPTTYMASARDVYHEGALIFTAFQVQENGEWNQDFIRLCRRRIRNPDQWQGDFMAAIGAARIGERRLKEFVAKYGKEKVKKFMREWLNYTEQRTIRALSELPSGKVTWYNTHDAIEPFLPEELTIKVDVEVDAENSFVEIDLRDNPDNVDCGLNLSRASATMVACQGVFNCIDPDVPFNDGRFRRFKVHLREGCVVGIPQHPYSASCGSTPLTDVVLNATQSAVTSMQKGIGLAQGNVAQTAGAGVISGFDSKRKHRYVNQLFLMGGGAPASYHTDGFEYYLIAPGAGLLYRDSVENDEQKFPFYIKSMRFLPDTSGAGEYRGGPATEVVYGPIGDDPMNVVFTCNGRENPPRGIHGGGDANFSRNIVIHKDGTERVCQPFEVVTLQPGEFIKAIDCAGAGYGNPFDRDPARVLSDVVDRYVTLDAAREKYGVVITGDPDKEDLAVDIASTEALRSEMRLNA